MIYWLRKIKKRHNRLLQSKSFLKTFLIPDRFFFQEFFLNLKCMKHNLLVPKKFILPIAIFAFSIILIGAFFRITHLSFFGLSGNILITSGALLSLISTVVAIIDILLNKVNNYILWLLLLLIFGGITSIFYLFNRNELNLKKNQ